MASPDYKIRLVEYVLAALKDDADKETLTVLILASLAKATDDGLEEAQRMLTLIGEGAPEARQTAQFFAGVIRQLRDLNNRNPITIL